MGTYFPHYFPSGKPKHVQRMCREERKDLDGEEEEEEALGEFNI